jgi:hypothetical protein
MKNLFVPAVKVMTFASIVLLTNCSKDKPGPVSCTESASRLAETGAAWTNDPSNKSKCEAYKNAISNILKSCPTYYSGGISQEDLDDLCK